MEQEDPEQGPVAAYTGDGLRWAFGHLNLRAQVGALMEEMLATVEHWKLANDAEGYKLALQEAQAEAARLRAAYVALAHERALEAQKAAALKKAARQTRDRFVEGLLLAARDIMAREAAARRAEASAKAVLARAAAAERGTADGGEGKGAAAAGPAVQVQEERQPATEEQGQVVVAPSPPPLAPPQQPPPPPRVHTLFHTVMELEETLLLRVFAFLSAPDVLVAAEVCKPFYRRVGAIFGDGGEDNGGEASTPTPAAPSAATATDAARGRSNSGGSVSSSTAAAAASFFRQYGSLLSGGGGSGGSGGGSEGFSLAALTASFLPPPSRASAAAKSVLESGPAMSDKVASAVTAKLSGAELKGILALTERLRRMEGLVRQFQAENEDALQRLSGAESMKALLLQRLQEAERALGRERDGASGVARQRASDQEVISFLDGRVHDLEGALQETAERLAAFREETRREKAQLQEQQRALRDMLAFERAQAEARSSEFRAQKRLLAKEVKSLRSELLVCQRERDAYRHDLRALRESALLGLGVGGGGPRR